MEKFRLFIEFNEGKQSKPLSEIFDIIEKNRDSISCYTSVVGTMQDFYVAIDEVKEP